MKSTIIYNSSHINMVNIDHNSYSLTLENYNVKVFGALTCRPKPTKQVSLSMLYYMVEHIV